MASGEGTQRGTIGKATTVEIGLVTVLIGAAAAAGAAHYRLGAVEHQLQEINTDRKAEAVVREETSKAAAVQQTKLDSIQDTVRRIERRVDELRLNGSVVPAEERRR